MSGSKGMVWFVLFLVAVVAGVLGLSLAYPVSLGTEDAHTQLAYGLVLLAVLSSSFALATQAQFGKTLRAGLAWAAIAMGVATLYTYHGGFAVLGEQILMQLDPAEPRSDNGIVTLREDGDGHFLANAIIGDSRVRFLIDTGASDVVLSQSDAKRIGIDVAKLDYTVPVSTANGMTFVAPVRLRSIKIGTIELRGVDAQVAKSVNGSLLGMSYLHRLSSYEFSHRELILKE